MNKAPFKMKFIKSSDLMILDINQNFLFLLLPRNVVDHSAMWKSGRDLLPTSPSPDIPHYLNLSFYKY